MKIYALTEGFIVPFMAHPIDDIFLTKCHFVGFFISLFKIIFYYLFSLVSQ